MDSQQTIFNIFGGAGGVGGQAHYLGGGGGVGQGPTLNIGDIHNMAIYGHFFSDEKYKLFEFISPLNFLPRQREIYETHEKNTGAWFLNDPAFNRWQSGHKSILWCSGDPGTGKTVLL
ncbi:NACHT and ankyrin domain protein [Mycena chlorophos]|uniref:NACHT and ankyrin domain protein n=1 Tax=Mycena chlorophos TaxID=658473 RepID=A0A8H6WIB1_MYCCL|nr:NACHT and ankyrin domain protein [Mycena chlorophos]